MGMVAASQARVRAGPGQEDSSETQDAGAAKELPFIPQQLHPKGTGGNLRLFHEGTTLPWDRPWAEKPVPIRSSE